MKFNPYDYDYSYSEWEQIIDECVFGERNKNIVKRKLLDRITFEELAEEKEMSSRQIQRIVDKALNKISKYI